ncbi:hypothetical protein BO70DRAFT_376559 [Aspergillus heteromorphus CBS 117.55]|uniref:C2H2-type domain-containing protein n=1 Tax=Aspergillus heteromorphus CBS 117.55 TaxID=1448321 RepID=A0A317WWF8_9EURO|nr:uncharacterized protein BO70DRAFT_376559 [Aspergillus heteromorphus CBS 117.55]PWY90689.1 hypothetical protein BO70DRAFT_376559 [Aspergillus heteromorphus CBS 117.55]
MELVSTEQGIQLYLALQDVSKNTLQDILMSLCYQVPHAYGLVEKRLFVDEDEVAPVDVTEEEDSDADDDDDDTEKSDVEDESESEGSNTARKRKRTQPEEDSAGPKKIRLRYAICMNCEEEYDVTDNTSESCKYHPGEPEPDDDFFAGHDERTWRDIDTPENREEYPQGFIYECCGKNGEEPCTTDWHRERGAVEPDMPRYNVFTGALYYY